jgi:hypothetical protein
MSSPGKLIGWLTTKIKAKVSDALNFSDMSPPKGKRGLLAVLRSMCRQSDKRKGKEEQSAAERKKKGRARKKRETARDGGAHKTGGYEDISLGVKFPLFCSRFFRFSFQKKNKKKEKKEKKNSNLHFLDEAVDESMPVAERVVRYSESPSIGHRMYVVRELVDLGKEVGFFFFFFFLSIFFLLIPIRLVQS